MLSSHLCRRPLNVIIQKSSQNLGQKPKEAEVVEKVADTDLFLTKLGIDEYNFAEDPLNDGQDHGQDQ